LGLAIGFKKTSIAKSQELGGYIFKTITFLFEDMN